MRPGKKRIRIRRKKRRGENDKGLGMVTNTSSFQPDSLFQKQGIDDCISGVRVGRGSDPV